MIFYNPFFPPFFRYPHIKSTCNSTPVQKTSNCITNHTNEPHHNEIKNPSINILNHRPSNSSYKNIQSENSLVIQKNNHKKFHTFGFIYDCFSDADTLIILGLLYFLYSQENKDFGLMLCLFLLLFD